MRKIILVAPSGKEQMELALPEGWTHRLDDEMWVFSRGESGLGTLQLSFAPHLASKGLPDSQLPALVAHFASVDADEPVTGERQWRRTLPGAFGEGAAKVVGAGAGARRGEWFVHCFVVCHRASSVFGTYVCRAADHPAEIAQVESMLLTLEIHPVPQGAAALPKLRRTLTPDPS